MHNCQKVAYLGGLGSYSHIGCQMKFPEAEQVSYATFADAFTAVKTGECDMGLIPIENAIAGRVADVHQLLPGSGLFIVGELFVPINHCLLGQKGATLADIFEVHSHVQALSQCRGFLTRHGLKTISAPDTSSAAAMVAREGNRACAAIAHRSVAEIHGLSIIANGIEDFEKNVTRFVVLSRERSARIDCFAQPITTISFDLGGNPSNLHDALGGFADNEINITRIESYLSRQTLNSSSFMIDFEGTTDDVRVRRILERLNKVADQIHLFGTYESAKQAQAKPKSLQPQSV